MPRPSLLGAPPDWQREGRDWPNRQASGFVTAAGIRWHVQRMGSGPSVLLIHGTGAATHSWRDLMPLLARRFAVVAPDLPGHGFTEMPPLDRLSLPAMAQSLGALMRTLGDAPDLVMGHSAGAAILARLCLDGLVSPKALIALNGAFLPYREGKGHLFSGLAKMLVLNPLVPRLFALGARGLGSVDKLIRDTGSTLDRRGAGYYERLVRSPGHVSGALGMMANWELRPLLRDLPRLAPRLVLVAAGNDRAIPPDQATRVASLVPGAEVVPMPGLGHLAHEERPHEVADLVFRVARETGVSEER